MQVEKTSGKAQRQQQKQQPQDRKIIRIADTDIDGNKKVSDALREIKGVGFSYSNAILKVLNIDGSKHLQDIDGPSMEKLKDALKNPMKFGIPSWVLNWRRDETTGSDYHFISTDLRSRMAMHIQALKDSRSYRGYRHSFSYKLRGQRVKSRGANFKGRVGRSLGVTKKTAQQQQKPAAGAGK